MSQRVATYEDLVAFLTEEKAPFRHDPAAQVAQIALRTGPLEGSLYLRWEKNLPYVQIVVPMVQGVAPARARDVADALCRVNHAIALPGFGYDFTKNFIYFRLTLAYDLEGIKAELLKRMILGAVTNARDFVMPLRAVVAGESSEKILELVSAQERAKRSGTGEDPASTFSE